MPVGETEAAEQAGYGRFPERIERDWLGRWCHLSEADVSLARRRTGDVTRLGFAVQLVTVRAVGTFLADPSAVPAPIVASVARQLDVTDPGVLAGYGKLAVCRHFAVLACALLRRQAIPARVRCGFATYFQPGQGVDHWIVEYLDDPGPRWVRLDPEILEGDVLARPDDLPPGSFLSGGEAWDAFRSGGIDASSFGVYGTDNWGAAEIRGNAVKDLAALNKVEMLPWDEWGRMTAAYRGETGPDYDDLLHNLAAACNADDRVAIASLYQHPDLRVPEALLT